MAYGQSISPRISWARALLEKISEVFGRRVIFHADSFKSWT